MMSTVMALAMYSATTGGQALAANGGEAETAPTSTTAPPPATTSSVVETTTTTEPATDEETFCEGWSVGVTYANQEARDQGATEQILPYCVFEEFIFTDWTGEEADRGYASNVNDPITGWSVDIDKYIWCSGMADGFEATLLEVPGASFEWDENPAWEDCLYFYEDFRP
jgi:hypothetical protein